MVFANNNVNLLKLMVGKHDIPINWNINDPDDSKLDVACYAMTETYNSINVLNTLRFTLNINNMPYLRLLSSAIDANNIFLVKFIIDNLIGSNPYRIEQLLLAKRCQCLRLSKTGEMFDVLDKYIITANFKTNANIDANEAGYSCVASNRVALYEYMIKCNKQWREYILTHLQNQQEKLFQHNNKQDLLHFGLKYDYNNKFGIINIAMTVIKGKDVGYRDIVKFLNCRQGLAMATKTEKKQQSNVNKNNNRNNHNGQDSSIRFYRTFDTWKRKNEEEKESILESEIGIKHALEYYSAKWNLTTYFENNFAIIGQRKPKFKYELMNGYNKGDGNIGTKYTERIDNVIIALAENNNYELVMKYIEIQNIVISRSLIKTAIRRFNLEISKYILNRAIDQFNNQENMCFEEGGIMVDIQLKNIAFVYGKIELLNEYL